MRQAGRHGWQSSSTPHASSLIPDPIVQEALAALCAQAQLLLPSFTPQGLSNTAWSLGRLGHRDSALMEGIAQASLRMLPSFSPHELALLASGFGGGALGCGGT